LLYVSDKRLIKSLVKKFKAIVYPNYKKYHSGFVARKSEVGANKLLKGKFFRLSFGKACRSFHPDDSSEIIIECKDFLTARKVSQLLSASLTLYNGFPFFPHDTLPLTIDVKDNYEEVTKFSTAPTAFQTVGIPKAAQIAVKSSFRKRHYYSLLKYQLACDLHSNDIFDLYYKQHVPLSRFPLDHIRPGYAIVVFYSVIEELGLEIRASKNKPSKIKGKWNKVVREDLENRLIQNKIDINESFLWILRSSPTKIERYNKPPIGIKLDFSKYEKRDAEIKIIDAIALVSWIRSKIVSHRLNEATFSLSIYDVANANILSRYLLMNAMNVYEIDF
jgi:hypothetical protein